MLKNKLIREKTLKYKNLNLNKFCSYFNLIRLNKPVGIFLLLWPTYWALWLSNRGLPDFYILFIFTTGVFLMRSAGCVVNDYVDRKFDAYVTRTKKRPLVNCSISIREAKNIFFC